MKMLFKSEAESMLTEANVVPLKLVNLSFKLYDVKHHFNAKVNFIEPCFFKYIILDIGASKLINKHYYSNANIHEPCFYTTMDSSSISIS